MNVSPLPEQSPEQGPALWRISTQWSQVNNPGHFVLRYADAIRRYLVSWMRDPHAADDVLQELMVQVTRQRFTNANPGRGRFRDYLIAIVRNAARRWLARGDHGPPLSSKIDVPDVRLDPAAERERSWLSEWRTCLLDRAFRALHAHEVETAGNCYYTVLRLVTERADADQAELAGELSRRLGRPVSHDAFRKSLSRARRHFALLLVREVALTLEAPTAADLEEELSALELHQHVVTFLPADWRQTVLTSMQILLN